MEPPSGRRDLPCMAETFLSITVVGSHRRVDVTLPAGVPASEILADLVALLDEQTDGTPICWGLTRLGGRVIDAEVGLGQQEVSDGALLFLRDLSQPPPPPALDDYAQAIAFEVDAAQGRLTRRLLQALLIGLAAGWILLAAVIAVWFGAGLPWWPEAVAAMAAAIVVGGALLTHWLGYPRSGAALSLATLPLWATGGALYGYRQSASIYLIAAGLTAGLAVGAFLSVAAGRHTLPVATGVIGFALPVLAAAGLTSHFGWSSVVGATVLTMVALSLIKFVPVATVRITRLDSVPLEAMHIARRLREARWLLASLLSCVSGLVALGAVVLAIEGDRFARLLAGMACVAIAVYARQFRFTAEVVPLLLAGVIGLAGLELALIQNLVGQPNQGLLSLPVLLASVGFLVACAVLGRNQKVGPRLGRALGRVETIALMAAVLLALDTLGAYQAAAAFARRLGG